MQETSKERIGFVSAGAKADPAKVAARRAAAEASRIAGADLESLPWTATSTFRDRADDGEHVYEVVLVGGQWRAYRDGSFQGESADIEVAKGLALDLPR